MSSTESTGYVSSAAGRIIAIYFPNPCIPTVNDFLDIHSRVPYYHCMPNTTPNPIKEMRENEGLTQVLYSQKIGITRIALQRYEQGCYPKPSEKFNLLPDQLEQYREFQHNQRLLAFGVLDPNFTPDLNLQESAAYEAGYYSTSPVGLGSLTHPLKLWRQASANSPTLTKVSVKLCLHLPTMHRFECAGSAVPPHSLLEALEESGYSNRTITLFVLAHSEYRARRRAALVTRTAG